MSQILKGRMRSLMDKRGFTLVEVIVASSIMLVIIGVTAGIMISSMGSFARVARMSEAKQIGLGAYNYCQGLLADAMAIGLYGSGDLGSTLPVNTLAVSDEGRLMYYISGGDPLDPVDVFGEDFYGGLRIQTTAWATAQSGVTDAAKNIVNLRVEVWLDENGDDLFDEGEVMFVTESAFRANNIYRSGGAIIDERPEGVEPKINDPIYFVN